MLENLLTFHQTVQGYNHIIHRNRETQEREPIDCEDASLSFSDLEKGYHIIVVADGHGDPACTRSKIGSRFATEIAMKCLREFSDIAIDSEQADENNSILSQLDYESSRRIVMRQLTNSIISGWYQKVDSDLATNLPNEKELQVAYNTRKVHMYGTTLIAALWIKNYLILIQQGDGRCDVFYEDGTVNQPIPWDKRCFGTSTTSMCNEDVVGSIRYCVIDTNIQKVMACFIGSDGVEDSYLNNEESQLGTHRFYRELSCKVVELEGNSERIENYLSQYLPSFSQDGSGDDISVAGIVDVTELGKWCEVFAEQNQRYDLNETLILRKAKLVSMERKHRALQEQVKALGIKVSTANQSKVRLETECHISGDRLRQAEQNLSIAQQEVEDFKQLCDKRTQGNDVTTGRFMSLVKNVIDPVSEGSLLFMVFNGWRDLRQGIQDSIDARHVRTIEKRIQQKCDSCLENVKQLQYAYKQKEQEWSQAKANYDQAFVNEQNARLEYEEYHKRYRDIEEECKRLQQQINAPIFLLLVQKPAPVESTEESVKPTPTEKTPHDVETEPLLEGTPKLQVELTPADISTPTSSNGEISEAEESASPENLDTSPISTDEDSCRNCTPEESGGDSQNTSLGGDESVVQDDFTELSTAPVNKGE